MYTRNYTDMWKNIFGLRILKKIDLERGATAEKEEYKYTCSGSG